MAVSGANQSVNPALLPVVVALVPILAVVGSATIAMQNSLVPACNPFFDGCTSISATGRYVPAAYLFRGVLLPTAAMLFAYWWLVAVWCGQQSGRASALAGWIVALGTVSSASLALYVTLLGSQGEAYEFMRRFGIYVFFAFAAVCQLLSALAMRRESDPAIRRAASLQLVVCVAMVALGILNTVLNAVLADADRSENVIEWWFGLMLFANFAWIAGAWRRTGFRIRFSTGPAD